MSGMAATQAQDSYIIVHALNPEGIEIASIEGNGGTLPFSVEIFDGAEHIGYAPQNAETHNVPIPIRPGNHTIRALFNGMTKEQFIVLNPTETRQVVFTFDRTNYANEIRGRLAKTYTKTLSRTDMTVPPGYPGEVYYASLSDECMFTWGYFYVWYCSASASVKIEVSASLSEDILHLQKNVTEGTASFSDIRQPEYYGVRIYSLSHTAGWCNIVALPPICDAWFVQSESDPAGPGGGLALLSDEDPYVSACFGVPLSSTGEIYIESLPPGAYSLFDRDADWIGEYRNTRWIDEYGNARSTEEIDNFGYVQDFRLSLVSNVPYDLLGTGIKCGGGGDEPPPENQPPVASFKSLNVVDLGDTNEETFEGGHMVGGVIRFDPTESYDPDGTIQSYEWDFDGGEQISSDLAKRDVVFKSPRVYTVTLTVTDNTGLEDTYTENLDLSLKEGDLIFIRTAVYSTGFSLLGHTYTHVGMYVGDSWMIESIATGNGRSGGNAGVVETLVRGWAYPYETLATLARVRTADESVIQKAVEFAKSKKDQGYDLLVYKKSTKQRNYYCSELIWAAYYEASKEIRGPKGIIDLGNKGKKGGVWPDDIANDTANVERIGYHHEHFPW